MNESNSVTEDCMEPLDHMNVGVGMLGRSTGQWRIEK